jgi:hypothetical protein
MSTFMLFTDPSDGLPRPSHAHLLDRICIEKTAAAEARLRTQVRLRARLAAERRLAQDCVGKDNSNMFSRLTSHEPLLSPSGEVLLGISGSGWKGYMA